MMKIFLLPDHFYNYLKQIEKSTFKTPQKLCNKKAI